MQPVTGLLTHTRVTSGTSNVSELLLENLFFMSRNTGRKREGRAPYDPSLIPSVENTETNNVDSRETSES